MDASDYEIVKRLSIMVLRMQLPSKNYERRSVYGDFKIFYYG